MKRSVIAITFVLGLFGLLAAGPAEAQTWCGQCDCEDSCDTPCRYGPFVIDCPECNVGTCGSHGAMCASSPECDEEGCLFPSCTANIYGNSSNNTIDGTAASECIYGYDGNDTLDGKAGDDWIWGGNGTDTIYGDSGNDCLWGDANADHLDGGSGADVGDGGTGTDTCTSTVETKINCP